MRKTGLGDGTVWIWKLASRLLLEATQIVDIYHAREHLHELAAALTFVVPDPQQWLQDRLDELDAGNIEAIIAAATEYPPVGVKVTDRDKALTYFRTNTARRRYARYRKLGMFIGSGNIEASCKAVIGQRLKLSGRHWAAPGATGILTLRTQQASGPWDRVQVSWSDSELDGLGNCLVVDAGDATDVMFGVSGKEKGSSFLRCGLSRSRTQQGRAQWKLTRARP